MSEFSPIRQSVSLESPQVEEVHKFGSWRVLSVLPSMALPGVVHVPQQIHGGNIVKTDVLGRYQAEADGVLVSATGIMAGVSTADCLPLAILAGKRALALHVSRKTLVNGLLDNVMTYIEPSEIDRVYAGPHICEYHFGFEEEGSMVRRFRYRFPEAAHFHKGKLYLSLKKALNHYVEQWQVHPDKVIADGRCTLEHEDLPSYRRDGTDTAAERRGLTTVVWQEA